MYVRCSDCSGRTGGLPVCSVKRGKKGDGDALWTTSGSHALRGNPRLGRSASRIRGGRPLPLAVTQSVLKSCPRRAWAPGVFYKGGRGPFRVWVARPEVLPRAWLGCKDGTPSVAQLFYKAVKTRHHFQLDNFLIWTPYPLPGAHGISFAFSYPIGSGFLLVFLL
jgi:hypothetical protein